MKNIAEKINNVTTEQGFLTAEDMNSIINELKNAISTSVELNANDNNQLAKAIDIATKSVFYKDIGSENELHLVRTSTQNNIETLVEGTTVFFTPANANTGDFKIKLNTLPAKDAANATGSNFDGFLQADELYAAVYDKVNDKFKVYQVSVNVSEYSTVKATKDIKDKLTIKINSVGDALDDRIDDLKEYTEDEVKKLNDRVDAISINVDFGTL